MHESRRLWLESSIKGIYKFLPVAALTVLIVVGLFVVCVALVIAFARAGDPPTARPPSPKPTDTSLLNTFTEILMPHAAEINANLSAAARQGRRLQQVSDGLETFWRVFANSFDLAAARAPLHHNERSCMLAFVNKDSRRDGSNMCPANRRSRLVYTCTLPGPDQVHQTLNSNTACPDRSFSVMSQYTQQRHPLRNTDSLKEWVHRQIPVQELAACCAL